MEVDDIEDEKEEGDDEAFVVEAPSTSEPESAETLAARSKALLEEQIMQEAARREKAALLEKAGAGSLPPQADAQSRLNYLMTQSEVFSHFLAGSNGAAQGGGEEKWKKRGNGGRGSNNARRLSYSRSNVLTPLSPPPLRRSNPHD